MVPAAAECAGAARVVRVEPCEARSNPIDQDVVPLASRCLDGLGEENVGRMIVSSCPVDPDHQFRIGGLSQSQSVQGRNAKSAHREIAGERGLATVEQRFAARKKGLDAACCEVRAKCPLSMPPRLTRSVSIRGFAMTASMILGAAWASSSIDPASCQPALWQCAASLWTSAISSFSCNGAQAASMPLTTSAAMSAKRSLTSARLVNRGGGDSPRPPPE